MAKAESERSKLNPDGTNPAKSWIDLYSTEDISILYYKLEGGTLTPLNDGSTLENNDKVFVGYMEK
jgi:hypothetical protein